MISTPWESVETREGKQHLLTPKVPTNTPSLYTRSSSQQQPKTLPPKAKALPAEPALPTLPPAQVPWWVTCSGTSHQHHADRDHIHASTWQAGSRGCVSPILDPRIVGENLGMQELPEVVESRRQGR